MLRVENLDVSYRRTQVLFGVSLEVPAGGLVCVMGRNGVGKTTLLNTVMGVLPAGRAGCCGATRTSPGSSPTSGCGPASATSPRATPPSRS